MKIKWLAILMALVLALASIPAVATEAEEDQWMNILLMGGDSRSTESYARTDAMIILSINREESVFKMTSVMRDTWVELKNGQMGKINAANVYGGPELAMKVVNENFGTDIEDYVMVNMYDLVHIVDLVGGVEIEITETEREYANKYVEDYLNSVAAYDGDTYLEESGLVWMNGLQAMAYCRNRYSDNDYHRVMRQQNVLLAMAEKMQNMEVNDLMDVLDQIMDYVQTDMDTEVMKDLAYTGLSTDIEYVEQYRIPADGTFESGMYGDTWCIKPDFKTNAKLLKEFIYGE